jgi:4-cresol dehydrogenase (hydroxylating)
MLEALLEAHSILKGKPSTYFVKHAYFKARRPKPPDGDIDPARDNCGVIWAGPVVPLTGTEVRRFIDLSTPVYKRYGLDYSTVLMLVNARCAIILNSVFYDKEDADERQRAHALYHEMCDVTAEAGYQQYRTSLAYMGKILSRNQPFLGLADRIKAAVDPNNILAPGKYGIGATG